MKSSKLTILIRSPFVEARDVETLRWIKTLLFARHLGINGIVSAFSA